MTNTNRPSRPFLALDIDTEKPRREQVVVSIDKKAADSSVQVRRPKLFLAL
jgi:hypothetical protein